MNTIYKTLAFLVLLCAGYQSMAQNFITQWNLATAGSGATQLSFGTATGGIVNYTWQEISPGTASGSGSWSGSTLTITGLPAGATIRLQIAPTNFQRIIINNGTDRNRLSQIEAWGSTTWESMGGAFAGCVNLQVTAIDIPNLSGVTDMSRMFDGCTILNSPNNINSWNTATVTNMSNLFSNAIVFNQNIGGWNTSAVTDMSFMFDRALFYNQNIGNWNTTAVTTMRGMFQIASAFNNGGNNSINSWNTGAVTNMSSMFSLATSFNQNIGSWNTSGVTTMESMFSGASSFNNGGNGSINNWNTGIVTTMADMFKESAFNQNIGSWNTGVVNDMHGMFWGASAFNQNIGTWNTSSVSDMSNMFWRSISFNQYIGGWNTGSVINMTGMFNGASSFNQGIGSWNTNAIQSMAYMFYQASAFNQDISAWSTGAVTSMWSMFEESAFNQNISAWILNSSVVLFYMFENSDMDCNNYSATLLGWSANPSTPNGRTLGATGRQYGTNAVAARTNLTTTKGWTIAGDSPSGSLCVVGAITILPQPTTIAVCGGATASLTIGASGTTNILYQWQKFNGTVFTDVANGGGYSGATSTSFNVNTSGNFGAGEYRCKVSGDLAADVFSNIVTLTINAIPAAPTSPVNGSSCGTAVINLNVSGGTNGQYRWYTTASGGTPITGEVNDTYFTPLIAATTSYYVSIDDGICESGRTPVIATINSPPPKPTIASSITPTGGNVSVCSSNILTLTAPAGFSLYAWSNGETTQQITIATSGIYTVIVTNAGGCNSPSSDAIITTVIPAPCLNQSPVINTIQATTPIAGKASIDLTLLISDVDNNLDLATLKIISQPSSGATAQITNTILTIDYSGLSFAGIDKLTIEVCDLLGSCTQKELTINVVGEIIIYTAISPNGDLFNEKWIIQNIESLPDTKENKVSIFNRWGDLIFETVNYNNDTRVFKGISKNGNEVTSGVYFYKIEFASGKENLTGYLTIKK